MSKQEDKPMTLDELEGFDDRKYANVNIGGGVLRLQNLFTEEAIEAEAKMAELQKEAEEEGSKKSYSYEFGLLVAMLVDEHGNRLYPTEKLLNGYERIGRLSISANKALIRASRELHQLPPDVEGDIEEVIEEVAKNSETPPDSISSSSPEGSEELTPIN